jgi:hypothetical protein
VNQSRVESVSGGYFRALGRGDGPAAFQLLCEEARSRTTEADLSGLLAEARRPISVSGFTRATGPDSPLLWSRDGLAVLNLEMGDTTSSRRIEMRNEGGWLLDNGWKVCPAVSTSLEGRGSS